MEDLKIFAWHKPSGLGHVINVSDLKLEGVEELSNHGVCDLITHPIIRGEIISAFGERECSTSQYSAENFDVIFYQEL